MNRLPLAAVFAMAATLFAQQPGMGNEFDTIVNYYSSAGLQDAVSRLQQRLSSSQTKLKFEPSHGYLFSVLKELSVPINSQVLVWSKTSSQAEHTSPATPRALYFNDDVYVGWAKDDGLLDLIAIDPHKGPIFFTLDQRPSGRPSFARDARCLNCHFNNKTLNVPGLVVRSVFAKPDGGAMAQLSAFIAGHNNPLSQRWGGWYVTGTHGQDTHMGNAFLYGRDPEHLDLRQTSNVTDLTTRFDTAPYLSPHSDTVALMVLDDAVRMENLITRARFQALHDTSPEMLVRAGEPLLAYLLFRDEAPLHGPIAGTTDFARQFAKAGPLREFDLKTRLFKYPCHYRIYSPGFDAMPDQIKNYIWMRLCEILSGKDDSPLYRDMAAADRKNVMQILLETKPAFKAWTQAHHTH